jgi:two-component system CheB/CheR fusion protein
LHDETGAPVALASIAKDITAQKQAEQVAREASALRDQFLAMLSHELRNPLAALLNAVRYFHRAGNDPTVASHVTAVIERQTRHMARLLDDLLDVVRITLGKIQIRKSVLDLRESVRETVLMVQPQIEQLQHQLHVALPPEPVRIEGDPARILQIQENLLANAVKYTPPGGEIHITLHTESGNAVLIVRDNGQGIEPEMLDKIFELFVQADHTREQPDGGMGIGLTMVRTLTHLHGGQVHVRSAGPGQGSEFEVRIPLTEKIPAPLEQPQDVAPRKLKILIVEDNTDNRLMLESLLKLDGYDVVTAADGIQGYFALVEQQPDVALIDLGLPGMDGYEVARKARAEKMADSTRLIALTGYGSAQDRRQVQAAGFDEHLVKPIDPSELSEILQKQP